MQIEASNRHCSYVLLPVLKTLVSVTTIELVQRLNPVGIVIMI